MRPFSPQLLRISLFYRRILREAALHLRRFGLFGRIQKISYTFSDLMEMLVHELTHQTMFLDELRYAHFSYADVLDRSTWEKSTILNVARQLDKVLHSIIVAIEILLFRDMPGILLLHAFTRQPTYSSDS
ncbi:MAG: hypothetical protein CBARDCOR_6744 [uncultured Caballeronia sp.]|nr:MAG: hypothetical protein CBARDCOR_6744 [uncultured Caballeronia sp.]